MDSLYKNIHRVIHKRKKNKKNRDLKKNIVFQCICYALLGIGLNRSVQVFELVHEMTFERNICRKR